MADCTFCEFIKGKRRTNINGYPFIILNETRHTLSFLGTDFLPHKGAQIIMIPKKHFERFEELPKPQLHDISEQLSLTVRIIRQQNNGCNVLLNDGKPAGQKIMHVHFHIIPRTKDDKIRIESWRRSNLSVKEFKKLSDHLRRRFKSYRF